MTLTLKSKPSLDEFIKTCTPLAIIDSLEQEFDQRVRNIASALSDYVPSADPVENIKQFLKADPDFIGILLALTNLSQEKFLRILSAERHARGDYGVAWGIDAVQRKIATDDRFVERIAHLFLEGKDNTLLTQHIAPFDLKQLELLPNWEGVIRDEQAIKTFIRRKLMGEYNDRKGDAIEAIIRTQLDAICTQYGFDHSKGQVLLFGKEVDHVLPSIEDPLVMIMTSYMETTGSGQTTRANEQSEMYGIIQRENRRYGVERKLVNFIDGAGWLARRSDLRKMHASCDYIINLKTLDSLEAIICKHIRDRFFTKAPRPQVEG